MVIFRILNQSLTQSNKYQNRNDPIAIPHSGSLIQTKITIAVQTAKTSSSIIFTTFQSVPFNLYQARPAAYYLLNMNLSTATRLNRYEPAINLNGIPTSDLIHLSSVLSEIPK